jgi:hypothetical protein
MALDIGNVYSRLRQAILEKRDDLATQVGSVIHDVFLTPVATELTKLENNRIFVSDMQSLQRISEILDDTAYLETVAASLNLTVAELRAVISTIIEGFATNYGLGRKAASYATGFVYVYTYDRPTSDLTVPVGTHFRAPDTGVDYVSTKDVTLLVASVDSYYDADLAAYALQVPVQAATAGTIGNVADGAITLKVSSIPFSYVTNKIPITNAHDTETDQELITRIQTKLMGNNSATAVGYRNLILDNTDINDCLVVGAGDPYMYRDNGYGGMVDIYIRGEALVEVTESHAATELISIGGHKYLPVDKQPIRSVSNLTINGDSVNTEDITTYTAENTDFVTVGSIYERTYVRHADLDIAAGTISITYQYDSKPEEIQNWINDPSRKILGSNVLIKAAAKVPVKISFDIIVKPGYNKATVATSIQSTIFNAINLYYMGQKVEQSDIIALAYTVSGLDTIMLPMSVFNRKSESDTAVNIIEITAREYAVVESLSDITIG